MVRRYIRKTNHKLYDVETIVSALKSLRETKKSLREVAQDHNMKLSALSYHWAKHKEVVSGKKQDKENMDITENVLKKRNTLRIFPNDLEQQLLLCINQCVDVYSTVGALWFRQLAYELALENKIDIPQNWKKQQIAGKDWYLTFKQRHSKTLREQIIESTSLQDVMGCHKKKAEFFHNNYGKVLSKYKFQPKDVFILEQCKIPDTSTKGQDEKPRKTGKTVTFVSTVSAIGQPIPPYYIFPYSRYHDHKLLKEAPKGCKAKSNPSGGMTKAIFLDYLKHMIDNVERSDKKPILILLEDRRYHFSLRILKFAKENAIMILTFPQRTRNIRQLLERRMFDSVKTDIQIDDFRIEDDFDDEDVLKIDDLEFMEDELNETEFMNDMCDDIFLHEFHLHFPFD